jgi:hypothetical protein
MLGAACHLLALLPILTEDSPPRPPAPTAGREVQRDAQLLKAAGIPTDGPGLLKWFRQRTALAADPQRLARLVRGLGHRLYRVRARASAELIAVGAPAVPALRRALKDPDLEIVYRARQALAMIRAGRGTARVISAARLVKARRPAGACPVLLNYLPWADGEAAEEEVLLSLLALGVQGGKPDPALTAALRDREPGRRAAAALVVGLAGGSEQRSVVRRLLTDPHPKVRFRAAQGLLAAHDKTAVPALIALLEVGPLALAEQAENLLWHLAGDRSPNSALHASQAARRRSRAVWEAWWKEHGDAVDLGRVSRNLLFDPDVRATAAARRFLKAWITGEKDALRKAVEMPFVLRGVPTSPERLDRYLGEVPAAWKRMHLTPRVRVQIRKVEKLRAYAAVSYAEENLLKLISRPEEVRAVYLYSNVYRGAVFVRVVGAQTRVIGLGIVRAPFRRKK